MPQSDVLLTVDHYAIIVPAAVCLLTAYRAWGLRRVLVDPVYRSRALWTGIGGFGFLALILAEVGDALAAQGYGVLANPTVAYIVAEISWGLAFFGIYGWLYTNINVSLSSDFLHRDALRWNHWGKTLFVALAVVGYALASIPPTPAAQILTAYPWLTSIVGNIFAVITAYAALVVAITLRRIKDRQIKNYTKWVGLSVLGAILGIFVFSSFSIPYLSPMAIPAYLMYRAAGSLSIRTHKLDST